LPKIRLRRPSSDGMPPWRLLFDSWRLVNQVRLATQGGMDPEMPPDSRSRAMTRRGDVALQVIPCQPQNSRDALLHEGKTPAAGPERWDLKQRRDCLSFSVSLQMPSEKKAKKQRDLTRPGGNKTPEDAIVARLCEMKPRYPSEEDRCLSGILGYHFKYVAHMYTCGSMTYK
jgi:hypothetical protein